MNATLRNDKTKECKFVMTCKDVGTYVITPITNQINIRFLLGHSSLAE